MHKCWTSPYSRFNLVDTWFLRDPRTPYGGVKESGIGRQGGMYNIDFYSDISTICMKY
ncbi:aldehyde dehydrogenase family protein [Paenibacillus sp. N3.4]|uniref:aldehyde dehydrogenase family protein n=1 Tax=Paenibacillus sp. N3.4 TaxID=2603222 RepID=UPI0037CC54DD